MIALKRLGTVWKDCIDCFPVQFCNWYQFPTYAVQAALLCGSTTAENRTKPQTYREGTVYWPLSKRKPTATFRETTQLQPSFRDKNICRTAENRSLNRLTGKVV